MIYYGLYRDSIGPAIILAAELVLLVDKHGVSFTLSNKEGVKHYAETTIKVLI